jgi:hypothetical protein
MNWWGRLRCASTTASASDHRLIVASIVNRRARRRFPHLACGTGVHRIDHVARINHANVTEAADVAVAALSPRLVPRRPSKVGPRAQAPRRLAVEATVVLLRPWPALLAVPVTRPRGSPRKGASRIVDI